MQVRINHRNVAAFLREKQMSGKGLTYMEHVTQAVLRDAIMAGRSIKTYQELQEAVQERIEGEFV